MKSYVVLSGNIGVGKTTLVELLSRRLGWEPYYEPVAENPYLEDFYGDMPRWAFHSQVFFLAHRARSHGELLGAGRPAVQDRSFYEDAEVFARSLHVRGAIDDRDWETYLGLYRTLTSLLAPPDLVVYLRASVPTLRRRIARRGRAFEARVSDDYLEGLNSLYETWIGGMEVAPVLEVDSDRLDFVEDSADLDEIVSGILARLGGRQQDLFSADP